MNGPMNAPKIANGTTSGLSSLAQRLRDSRDVVAVTDHRADRDGAGSAFAC
jgi:hypothetical protein